MEKITEILTVLDTTKELDRQCKQAKQDIETLNKIVELNKGEINNSILKVLLHEYTKSIHDIVVRASIVNKQLAIERDKVRNTLIEI